MLNASRAVRTNQRQRKHTTHKVNPLHDFACIVEVKHFNIYTNMGGRAGGGASAGMGKGSRSGRFQVEVRGAVSEADVKRITDAAKDTLTWKNLLSPTKL